MAEGPQVLLRAEWLDRQLGGRTPLAVEGWTEAMRPLAMQLSNRRVERVFARAFAIAASQKIGSFFTETSP